MWTPAQLDAWRAAHPSKQPVRKRHNHQPPIGQRTDQASHNLRVCLAFATMRRHPLLTANLQLLTEQTMRATAQELGAKIEEFHSQADLIRLTVTYPSAVSVASLAKRLRGAASRALRTGSTSPNIWSKPYYAASMGSHSSAKLSQYVEHLEQPVNN